MCFAWMLQDQSQGDRLIFKGLIILGFLWIMPLAEDAARIFNFSLYNF